MFGRPGNRQALNRANPYLDLVPKGRDEEGFKFPMEWIRRDALSSASEDTGGPTQPDGCRQGPLEVAFTLHLRSCLFVKAACLGTDRPNDNPAYKSEFCLIVPVVPRTGS